MLRVLFQNVLLLVHLAATLFASASSAFKAPTGGFRHPQLIPFTPKYLDTTDFRHLSPSAEAQLWFAQELRTEADQRLHATLHAAFNHDAVILDHSTNTVESCTSDKSLSIVFKSSAALEVALKNWPEDSPILFVTSKASCGVQSVDTHHVFFHSTKIVFDESSLSAISYGKILNVQEALRDGRIEWGTMATPASTAYPPTIATLEKRASQTTSTATSTSSHSCEIKHSKKRHCGTRGELKSPAPLPVQPASGSSFGGCRDACLANHACKSFGFLSGNCTLYRKTIVRQKFVAGQSGALFYNRHCFVCSTSTLPATTTSLGSTTLSTSTKTITKKPSTTTKSSSSRKTKNSSSTSVGSAACNPPQPTISGLPATSYCTTEFDANLDTLLGSVDLQDPSVLASVAPGLTADQIAEIEGSGGSSRRLAKRFSLKSAIKSVAKAVVKAAVKEITTAAKVVAKAASAAVTFVGKVVKAIVDAFEHPGIHLYFPAYFGFPPKDTSPWGPAFKLMQYVPKKAGSGASKKISEEKEEKELLPDALDDTPNVGIYCVNCDIKALFTISGTVSFSLLHGITDGQVKATGDFYAGVYIGIDALYIFKQKLASTRLVHQGYPGFEIPGIIVLGPELTIDAEASLEIKAEGQILAGFNMSMPNAVAVMDIMDSRKSYQTGWKPVYSHSFEVHGELSVSLVYELPIGLAFGIELFKGKYSKQVAVVNTPSVEYFAGIEVEYTYEQKTLPNGTVVTTTTPSDEVFNDGECPGIQYGVSLNDKLDINLLGYKDIQLFATSTTVASGCVTLWTEPTGEPTSAPTTGPTTGPTAVPTPTATGIAYWIWPKAPNDGTQAATPAFIPVQKYNRNDGTWARSGVLTGNMNEAGAYTVAYGHWTYVLQGYLLPTTTGTYTFSLPWGADNDLLLWTGDQAHTNWTYNNKDFLGYCCAQPEPISPYYSPYSVQLTAGQLFPLTILYMNTGGPGNFQLGITTPDGQLHEDLTGFFVYNLKGFNDGSKTANAKPKSPREAVLRSSHERSLSPDAGSLSERTSFVVGTIDHRDIGARDSFSSSPGSSSSGSGSSFGGSSGAGASSSSGSSSSGSGSSSGGGSIGGSFSPPAGSSSGSSAGSGSGSPGQSPSEPGGPSLPPSPGSFGASSSPGVSNSEKPAGGSSAPSLSESEPNESGFVGLVTGPMAIFTDATDSELTISGLAASDPSTPYNFPNFTADGAYTTPSSSSNSSDDNLSFTNIVDTTSSVQLHEGADSNLYISSVDPTDAGGIFAGQDNVIPGDANENLFIYYADEMQALNVSRFRVMPGPNVPATAQLIALSPVSDGNGGYVYAAVDTLGNYFYLAACNIANQLTKVFLVQDYDTDLATLEKSDLAWIVTGGNVDSCGPLALVAQGGLPSS